MTAFVVNSEESLQRTLGELRQMFGKHKYLRLNLKTGKDRSLDQSALTHVWYQQIARELQEDDALGWKCFCKLTFGVPILRAEDNEFKAFYDGAIKSSLSYEQKLAAMKFVPITSEMTVQQLTKYADAMQKHFLTAGVILKSLGEEK